MITSHNEGTPVSLIEAMAAGVPVVSTAVGGVPDLLHKGELGRLVPPGDARALAEAISETLDEGRNARTAHAQQIALAQYDAARLVADVRRLYVEQLAQKGMPLPQAF